MTDDQTTLEARPSDLAEYKSAYEKGDEAGLDPRCIPHDLDGDPPLGDAIAPPTYPEGDHETWNFLFSRQLDLLPGRASETYLDGVERLGLGATGIPALRDLSRVLTRATDWTIARIPGLLHERDFFRLLSERKFPSTDYIRGKEELDYTPAPDMFHDIFGHMPTLTQPAFADFYQLFGQAALDAKGVDRQSLERFHWFTVEFGLVQDPSGYRLFGAGIMSSKGEVLNALSDNVEHRPFSPEGVVSQDYDVWHLQPILFVLESFEQLVEEFEGWAKSRKLL
ncbi:MAG: phenylalanine 4-monooxygenase [Bacteroidota bacterium]